ncbi:MAG: hypothetical protein IJB70_05980 [Clostridia bacterium]|nr:hypothetical protein [Clostridia bacterium]
MDINEKSAIRDNDYVMWFEVMKKAKIAHRLPKCLSYYIKHDDSVSGGSKWKLIKHHYILYKKGLKKNSFMSLLLTLNNLFFGVLKKIRYKEKIANTDKR